MTAEYVAKIKGDISSLEKALQKAQGEITRLNDNEVKIKLNYDENKAELNKIIKDLYNRSPKLGVQLEYEINKSALEAEKQKLSKMKMTLNLDDLSTELNHLSKAYNNMLDDFSTPQKDIDSLTKKMADLYATLLEIEKDSDKAFSKLSSSAKEIYEDLPEMANGDSLKIYSEKEINQEIKLLDELRKKQQELLKTGKISDDEFIKKDALDQLLYKFSEFAKLNNNNHLSGFWDNLKNQIEDGDEALKQILIDLDLINKESEKITPVAQGHVKSGGIIGENKVLLATKDGRATGRLQETLELKDKLDDLYASGVNVSRILDVIHDEVSDTFLEIQEKSPGEILGSVYDGENDYVNPEFYEATDQQVLKLIEDITALHKAGLGVDLNTTNIAYDKNKGFNLFDLDLKPANYESFREFINDFKGGITNSIRDFYESINDPDGINKINEFEERLDTLVSNISKDLSNGLDTPFNDNKDVILDSLKNLGVQLGNSITSGLYKGISDNSKSSDIGKELVQDVVDSIEEQIPEVTATVEKLGESVSNGLSNKSLEELLESYHQLGVSGGASEDLEKISSAILDIVQAENKLDPLQMSRFVEVMRGLGVSDENFIPIINEMYSVEQALTEINKLRGITNEAPVLSDESTDKAVEVTKELTETLENEQQVVENIGKTESTAFDGLNNAIKEVIESVNTKTNAFLEEESKVVSSVDNEINKIKELKDVLSDVKAEAGGVGESLKVTEQTATSVTNKQQTKNTTASTNKSDTISQAELEQQELDRLYAESQRKRESVLKEELKYRQAIAKAEQKTANDVIKAEENANKKRQSNLTKQSKMLKDFSLWVSQNGKAVKAFSPDIDEIFSKLNSSLELTDEELTNIQRRINNVMASAAQQGKVGVTLLDSIKQRFQSLVAYLTTFASFYDIIRYTREAITTIKDLDTQLVDLRKTTTMSASDLNEFYLEANNVAKQMGVTTSEIISQASAWSRLNKIGPLYGNI